MFKQNAHIPGGSVTNLVSLTRTNSAEHGLRRNKATAINVGNFRDMKDEKLGHGAQVPVYIL